MPPKLVTPKSKPTDTPQSSARRAPSKGPLKAKAKPPQRAVAQSKLLVRTAIATDSDKAGELSSGTVVFVVDTKETAPGVVRACVSATVDGPPQGWVTMSKDGTDNLVYQPAEAPVAVAKAPSAASAASAGGSNARSGPQPARQPSPTPRQPSPSPRQSAAARGATAEGGRAERSAPLPAKEGVGTRDPALTAIKETTTTTTRERPAGGFAAPTASAQQRVVRGQSRTRLERREARRVENEPVVENAEDFDWSTTGGGWTVEKWLSSLELHRVISAHFEREPPATEGETEDGGSEGAAAAATAGGSATDYTHAKQLTREDVVARLGSPELMEALVDAVMAGVEDLSNQVRARARARVATPVVTSSRLVRGSRAYACTCLRAGPPITRTRTHAHAHARVVRVCVCPFHSTMRRLVLHARARR